MSDKQLDPRLATIVAILKALACKRVHDLACDHGLVGAAYASAFPNYEVYLSDIACQPLSRAKELLSRLHLTNTHCLLSDGLQQHEEVSPLDCVVLAGLSGETIWRILKKDPRLAAPNYRERVPLFVIAQPMQIGAKFKLAAYLHDFAILHESLVLDKGRVQEIILLCNQPYYAMNISCDIQNRLIKLAAKLGQDSLFLHHDIYTYLKTWQKNLPDKLSLLADLQSNDVQQILQNVCLSYGEFQKNRAPKIASAYSEQANNVWQTLLALIACSLSSLLTLGDKSNASVLSTSVNYQNLLAKLELVKQTKLLGAKDVYLQNVVQYYQHKLPHLRTKNCYAPDNEKAFWRSILACLDL